MIRIAIKAAVKFPLRASEARRLAGLVARYEKKIRGEAELNVIGDALMRRLNRHYRGQDRTTDVLSFPWAAAGGKKFLGQIFMSASQINRQAKDFSVSAREEFARMLVHGLLHLAGHDHATIRTAKKMFGLQERVLKSFK